MVTKNDDKRFQNGAQEYALYLKTPEGRLRIDLAFSNLQEFLPPAQKSPMYALDVGCGTGSAAVRLAQLGFHVTQLDSSEAMLDIARRTAVEAGVANRVTVLHGDAAQLPSLFGAASFDVVLCHDMLKGRKSRVGWEPFRTVLLIMLDSGLRPGEIFRMRWENIHWEKGLIFNPRGKSRKSRRYVPLTERVKAALLMRKEGVNAPAVWYFWGRVKESRERTSTARDWNPARQAWTAAKGKKKTRLCRRGSPRRLSQVWPTLRQGKAV